MERAAHGPRFRSMTDQSTTDRKPAAGRDGNPRSAVKARQGIIVLREPWQRAVFVAGLAGAVIVGALIAWFAG